MQHFVYEICSETLVAALALGQTVPLPDSRAVRERMLACLDRMVSEGRRLGLDGADLAEARYALVAFIDEQVLRSSWPGRADWMKQPLQLILYRENAAGENFFARLRALLQREDRLPAVQVYALCLALGFRGAYGRSNDLESVSKFARAARRKLAKALPSPDIISPHLEVTQPSRQSRGLQRVLRVSVCSAAAVSILVLGLCGLLVRRASDLALSEISAVSVPREVLK